MKRRTVFFALLLILLLSGRSALADAAPTPTPQPETLDEALSGVMDGLDFSALPDAFGGFTGDEDTLRDTISRLAKGEKVWDAEALLKMLCEKLLSALSGSVWRLSYLLLPAILLSVLERMRDSFSHARVGEMLEYACFLVLAGFMAKDLTEHMTLAEGAIKRMAQAMQTLFPLLLTLLSAVGGTAGTAFFQPAVTAAGGTMTTLVRSFTLRFALGYGVVTILSHLSDQFRLTRIAALLKQVTTWTLGIAFTVFISVTALQGFGAAVTDGVSIRAAKYAVDNFVPVVGGMFADTMDTLVGSSLLIKNALGVTGLMALLFLSAGPMLQTLAGCAVYKAAAALMEVVAPRRVTDCVSDFSGVLTLLFVIQLSVGAMFFLLVAQLLAVGNLIVMLR